MPKKIDQAKSLRDQAKEAERKGDLKKAIELYEKAISIAEEPAFLNELGELYRKAGEKDKAVNVLWQALEKFKEMDFYPNAIAVAMKLKKIIGEDIELLEVLADLQNRQGLLADAISTYSRLAELLKKEGDIEGVIEVYKKMVEVTPKRVDLRLKLVDIYLSQGKTEEAVEELKKVRDIYEEQGKVEKVEEIEARIRELTGEEAVEEKKEEEAEEIKIVFEQTPEAKVFEEIKEEKEEEVKEIAPTIEEEVIKAPPSEIPEPGAEVAEAIGDWNEWVSLAELYLSVGSTDEAVEYLYKAADLNFDEGNFEKAEELYRKICELRPFELRPRQKLVQIALKKNNRKMAAEAYFELAECLERRGANEEARKNLEKARKLDPKNEKILKKLAGEKPVEVAPPKEEKETVISMEELLKEEAKPKAKFVVHEEAAPEGDFLTLEELLEEFKEGVFKHIGEGDYAAHYDLGVTYKEMGLIDEAIKEFEIASKGKNEELKALEMLGLCYEEKGELDKAEETYLRALAIEGHKPEEYIGFHYRLGNIYESQKRIEEAVKEYMKVAKLDPNFLDVRDKLKKLSSMIPKPGKKKEEKPEPAPGEVLKQLREDILKGLEEEEEKQDKISYM